MLQFDKRQYFALFIVSFLCVAAASVHDAIQTGQLLTPGITSAFFVAIGFMSKIKTK